MPPTELTGSQQSREQAAAADPKAICVRTLGIIADGELPDFEELIHPEAVNREAGREPLAARGRGPAAFYATALWLRSALADMHWDIHEVVSESGNVVIHSTAHGRQVGPFVIYDEAGAVRQVFPPTNKTNSGDSESRTR